MNSYSNIDIPRSSFSGIPPLLKLERLTQLSIEFCSIISQIFNKTI